MRVYFLLVYILFEKFIHFLSAAFLTLNYVTYIHLFIFGILERAKIHELSSGER